MTVAMIRKKVMSYLADADDKKIKAVYILLEDDIEKEPLLRLSRTQLERLEEERLKHHAGETPSSSWEEVKKRIRSGRKKH